MSCASIARACVGIDPALEVDEFLVGALAELRVRSSSGMPSALRQLRQAVGRLSSSCGLPQTDSTGEDTASGSPLRSVIMPREVAIGISRRKRASPCCAVEVVVDQLQVDRAPDQRHRAQAERAADERQPPAQVEARAIARASPAGPLPRAGWRGLAMTCWMSSWTHHHDVAAFREHHAQARRGDLVDAVALGPGRLLQLQAAEFDIELVARLFQLAQLR